MSKYLVVAKPSAPTPFPSSHEFAELMQRLQGEFEYQLSLQKKGKIIAGGPFLDRRGGCYILDVPSVEEMGEILFNSPLAPWFETEIHPIGSVEETLEGLRERMPAVSGKR
jgi:muconolactone delta-isomerase